ncbi:hypothetical protein OROGR_019698 [Orobanche gracilis]
MDNLRWIFLAAQRDLNDKNTSETAYDDEDLPYFSVAFSDEEDDGTAQCVADNKEVPDVKDCCYEDIEYDKGQFLIYIDI